MFASAGLQSFCKTQCTQCVGAAATECAAPGAALPAVCANGLAYNSMIKGLVSTCVAIFASDPQAALSRVPGC
jgi:hypothetical protein